MILERTENNWGELWQILIEQRILKLVRKNKLTWKKLYLVESGHLDKLKFDGLDKISYFVTSWSVDWQ